MPGLQRSERQQLAVRLEKQQATLDRHELRTNPDLGRADVYRIAERHRKVNKQRKAERQCFIERPPVR